MMENDDKLIQDFLLAHKQELPDQGFSRRVMRRLPVTQRAQQLSNLLTTVCTLLCCIWFYLFDGVHILWQLLQNLFAWQAYQWVMQGNLQMLTITLIVLTGLGVRRLWSLSA